MSYVERMREGYAAYSRSDPAMADTWFTKDIRWHVPGPQGPIQGREAVKEFFAGLTEMFSAHTIELNDAIESGDRLWCYVTHTFTRQDGSAHEVEAVHLWTVAGERLSAMHEVADTLAFGIAAGMIPAEALAAA